MSKYLKSHSLLTSTASATEFPPNSNSQSLSATPASFSKKDIDGYTQQDLLNFNELSESHKNIKLKKTAIPPPSLAQQEYTTQDTDNFSELMRSVQSTAEPME